MSGASAGPDPAAAAGSILPDERQRAILDRLSREGRVLAAQLAQEFGTSEDTVRRDLRELSAAGLCRRVYGGALPLSAASNPIAERVAEAPERKVLLGRRAAALVQALLRPRSLLFMDAGSTNLAIARALPADLAITVATNAPAIAAALSATPGLEVLMIGGRLDPRSGAVLGGRATLEVARLQPELALIGACAVDAGRGLAAHDAEEAEFKRVAAGAAVAVAAAVTAEKIGTRAPYAVAPASALAHLITERDVPEAALAPFLALGVRVHRAE